MSLRTPLALLLLAACRIEDPKDRETPADPADTDPADTDLADTDTGAPDDGDDSGVADPSDTAGLPAPCAAAACDAGTAAVICGSGATFPSVQAALDASVAGDLVHVCAGTWTGSLAVPAHALVIEGEGADVTVLSGGGVEAVLDVADAARLTLRDLTVADGVRAHAFGNSQGGGLAAEGAALRLARVVFRDNVANVGGGLGLEGGALVAVDSRFERNDSLRDSSDGGGAIYMNADGTVVLRRSVFVDNTTGRDGGALYQVGGSLLVEDATFTGNASTDARVGGGGALLVDDARSVEIAGTTFGDPAGSDDTVALSGDVVTVRDSAFLDDPSGGIGSALMLGAGDNDDVVHRVEGCTFIGNGGNSGAALDLWYRRSHTVTVEGCTFEGNVAADAGGAVLVAPSAGGTMRFVDSTFTGNEARARGGAVAWGGRNYEEPAEFSYVEEVTFEGCVFEDNSAALGGAFHFADAHVTVDGGAVRRNTASWEGGGLYVEELGAVEFVGVDLGAGADDNAPGDVNLPGAWGADATFTCTTEVCE